MQVHTPLVAEHKIIRRMMEAIGKWTEQVRGSGKGFNGHSDTVIDFLCMYVDRCHHVKEEEIFFHHLDKKKILEGDRKTMEELIQEHVFIMKSTGEIMSARSEAGSRGDGEIVERRLRILSGYYLEHIRKENETFFPRVPKYFSYYEQNSILQEFWRFNEKIPLEKYHAALHKMETLTGMASYPSIGLIQSR
ncbi:MAG: hemerythrin domain-containing protein [Desulfobacteraceae bacterium]|jgi:hemerythrin-like domain-containing protein|nr:MAG: hemerythrin domain-containing protein [Desulfobacteraceae bacterium]